MSVDQFRAIDDEDEDEVDAEDVGGVAVPEFAVGPPPTPAAAAASARQPDAAPGGPPPPASPYTKCDDPPAPDPPALLLLLLQLLSPLDQNANFFSQHSR